MYLPPAPKESILDTLRLTGRCDLMKIGARYIRPLRSSGLYPHHVRQSVSSLLRIHLSLHFVYTLHTSWHHLPEFPGVGSNTLSGGTRVDIPLGKMCDSFTKPPNKFSISCGLISRWCEPPWDIDSYSRCCMSELPFSAVSLLVVSILRWPRFDWLVPCA